MSETGDKADAKARVPAAIKRLGWWPGWLWSVPIAALGLVIWLAVRSLTQGGPEVKVIFPGIANLKPGDTQVEFQGLNVGQVEDIKVQPDLKHMRVTLSLHSDMEGHVGPGTQFWIIGKQLSLANPSDLKALITGVSIGIGPRPGPTQQEYQALAQAPVLGFGETGASFTLHAPTLGSLDRGTPVYFLDQQVGKIEDYAMVQGRGFDITVFIDAPYDGLVHQGSRFWRAGPIHLSTGGNGPTLQFQSVPALFQGAIAFETPAGATEGAAAAKGDRFTLYDGEDAARNAPDSRGVAYRVVFHDASGVPDVGAPVRLMGKRIGSVQTAALEYDPRAGSMSVIATIVLEPRNVGLADGATWADPRAQMDDMLRTLIAHGLQAGLAASPPVIGGQQVSLDIVPGQSGTLGAGPVPEIPSRSGSGGVAGIMASADDIMTKVNEMPLGQIADNLRDISRHVAQLTSSPALASTLRQVDRSTANLQRITGEVRTQITPTLTDLRRTVAEAQASLSSAQNLLSAQGAAASGPRSEGLPQTLYEISRTARSLREVSDFLDRHPSALLTGRSAEQ